MVGALGTAKCAVAPASAITVSTAILIFFSFRDIVCSYVFVGLHVRRHSVPCLGPRKECSTTEINFFGDTVPAIIVSCNGGIIIIIIYILIRGGGRPR